MSLESLPKLVMYMATVHGNFNKKQWFHKQHVLMQAKKTRNQQEKNLTLQFFPLLENYETLF